MASIHLSVADDASKAEARSLSGVKNGNFRVKESPYAGMDSVNQQTQDYYQRLVNEVERGERKPIKLSSWKSVMKESTDFFIGRIPRNIAEFNKHSSKDVSMAIIPCSFTTPHPTMAEKDAYMTRWDHGGDLYKKMVAECGKHTKKDVAIMPQIIHTANPESLLMVCLVVVVFKK